MSNMSKKLNSTTKLVLILTILGFVVPAIFISLFHEGSRPPVFLEIISGVVFIVGGIGAFVCCIIGVIGGITGIFGRKSNILDRLICLVCTLLCLNFIFFIFSPPAGSRTERSSRISCSSNLKQIYLSLKQYAEDYAGYYPPENGAAGLEVLRKNDYLTDYSVYICPSTLTVGGKGNQPLTEENMNYVYIGGLNTKSDPNLPLMYDKSNNHNHSNSDAFGNVLFVDGTIKGIEGNPWTKNIRK